MYCFFAAALTLSAAFIPTTTAFGQTLQPGACVVLDGRAYNVRTVTTDAGDTYILGFTAPDSTKVCLIPKSTTTGTYSLSKNGKVLQAGTYDLQAGETVRSNDLSKGTIRYYPGQCENVVVTFKDAQAKAVLFEGAYQAMLTLSDRCTYIVTISRGTVFPSPDGMNRVIVTFRGYENGFYHDNKVVLNAVLYFANGTTTTRIEGKDCSISFVVSPR